MPKSDQGCSDKNFPVHSDWVRIVMFFVSSDITAGTFDINVPLESSVPNLAIEIKSIGEKPSPDGDREFKYFASGDYPFPLYVLNRRTNNTL